MGFLFRRITRFILILLVIVIPTVYAADPISTTILSDDISAQTITGGSYSIVYQFTNNLPFQLPQPMTIDKQFLPAGTDAFSSVDNCANNRLNPGASCTVTVNFHPSNAGNYSMALVLNYANNVVRLPAKSTNTTAPQINVTGTILQNLPVSMILGDTASAKFQFTNSSNTTVQGITISTSGSSPTFTLTSNTCTNTLAPQASCQVIGNFTPQTTGAAQVKVNFSASNASTPPLVSNTTVNPAPAQVSGQVVNDLPSAAVVGTSYPVEFKFTNTSNTVAQGVVIQKSYPTGFTENTNNCGSQLAAQGVCTISGNFLPQNSQIGQQVKVAVTLTYTNSGTVPLSTVNTTVTSVSPPNITGSVVSSLPNPMTVANPGNVTFRFSNQGSAAATGLAASADASSTPNFQIDTDNCTGTTLAPSATCEVVGTFNPQAVGNSTVKINLIYNTNLQTSVTDNTVVSTGRTLKFVNNCPFPVWIGIASGAVPNKNGQDSGCSSNSDCPTGSACNPDADLGVGKCFWQSPAPADGNYKLDTSASRTVLLPEDNLIVVNNKPQLWSGGFAGRTGCDQGTCETASCGETGVNNMACKVGQGFEPPVTQFEISMYKSPSVYPDAYNLETIDGFNIPIQVEIKNADAVRDPAKPYFCESPGSMHPTNSQLGACSWEFDPPRVPNESSNLVKVAVNNPTTPCNNNSDCSSHNEVCGLSYDPLRTPTMQKTCGKFLGYWTVTQLCAKAGGENLISSLYQCTSPLPAPFSPPEEYQDLYKCKITGSDLDSCYKTGAPATCCGCVDWQHEGIIVPPPENSNDLCQNQSAVWISNALPNLIWLKQACPTLYVYQFDDKTTSFTCSVPDPHDNDHNVASYTVTYCPGGKTGAPPSVIAK